MKQSRLAQRKLGLSPKAVAKPKKHFPKKIFFLLFFLVILSLAIIVLIFGHNSKWDGSSKISIVFYDSDQNTNVDILDPQTGSITTLQIPPDVEVQAANNLGTWKLRSIPRLGTDKHLSGDFLKNTIIKAFNLPLDSWVNKDVTNFSLDTLFNSTSDLSVLDKFRIAIFALGVGNTKRTIIDLSQTAYLNKTQLIDGTLGWEIGGSVPATITPLFEYGDGNVNINVLLNNASSNRSLTTLFAKTLNTLGINISSTQRYATNTRNCLVISQDTKLVKKVANIFDCEESFSKPSGGFDLEIDLGDGAATRF